MTELFTIENLLTLGMLTLLQAVLGLDNLLYIVIESKRAEDIKQKKVRQVGIAGAVILRILLLFLLIRVIDYFQNPLLDFDNLFISGTFNLHSIIVLLGGVFIIYTATAEIFHMLSLEKDENNTRTPKSTNAIIFSIILMNLVFSFDSILAAMALTDVFSIMVVAIIIGGLLMIWFADRVSEFLKKNRMFEVLGLFILFIVGIMLLSEGGHLAHMQLFNNEVTPMSKTTFYFVIGVLILIDIIQSKYQKKLLMKSKL
jgi:predicted tellurium resistance membrane protein TerC